MRPLPTVGGDSGAWGTILNTYLGELVPPGAMFPYAGSSAPAGWLLCDGTSYLRADYNDLFTAMGGASSPWGLPDGTHFNVPDMRGRMPVGLGTNADVDALGETDGAALSSRTPKHKHTVNDSGHSHGSGNESAAGGPGGTNYPVRDGSNANFSMSATTGVTVGPQSNSPTDGPAYVVVNYIIKT